MLLGLFECDKIYVTIFLVTFIHFLFRYFLNNKNNSYTPILSNKCRCQVAIKNHSSLALTRRFPFFGALLFTERAGSMMFSDDPPFSASSAVSCPLLLPPFVTGSLSCWLDTAYCFNIASLSSSGPIASPKRFPSVAPVFFFLSSALTAALFSSLAFIFSSISAFLLLSSSPSLKSYASL